MITTATVTHEATKVRDGARRRWAHLCNRSAFTIYVKYDGSATALTVANGIPIGPGGVLMLGNNGRDSDFYHDIYAIHDQGESVEGSITIHEA